MKKLIFFVFWLLPALSWGQSESASQPRSLAFTHVTVIDVTGGEARADMTVVISGERITKIGRTGELTPPKAAQVVDAAGKFVIPGLWDMHVHWPWKDYLPLFIANGVTGVRMMWGSPQHHEWREEIRHGSLLGPRLRIASPIIDGPNPIWKGSVGVGSAVEARQAVIDAKKGGADFIKVYSLLSRESYFAIASEAKQQGIPYVGHVPEVLNAGEASDAGQKSIEHMSGVLLATSREEDAIRAEMLEIMAAGANEPSAIRFRRLTVNVKAAETYDPEKAAALFERFRENGTWQVPTLTVLRAITHLDDPEFTDDPRLKYVPPGLREYWEPKNDSRFSMYTAEDWAESRRVYARYLELTGAMQEAGVRFLAGTDVLNPYCFPGFSLHDEMSLLVEAGFTPLQALQAATLNPAKYLGRLDSLGTVEPGKLADLVLLDANPLADIGNTRRIEAVVKAGRLFTRSELDAMLARVAAVAKKEEDAARQQ